MAAAGWRGRVAWSRAEGPGGRGGAGATRVGQLRARDVGGRGQRGWRGSLRWGEPDRCRASGAEGVWG